MELIVTHDQADLDGFAAAFALRALLGGDAVVGLATAEQRDLDRFLAIHADRFRFQRVAHLDLDAVTRLHVVDVRDRRRLRHVEPAIARGVPLHVWDHHPASAHDVVGEVEHVAPVGAVTTLIVERLAAASVPIDREEATLFALGVYADTAALTLGHTSPRDARAVAWLLERGARLSVLNRYLEPPFADDQRAALHDVLGALAPVELATARVGVAAIERERRVDGLAEVASEALRLSDFAALFVLCALPGRDRVEVIGRARSGLVDVGGALDALGGGGHAGAGAAVVRGADLDAARERLRAALDAACVAPTTVSDVMSSPVETVAPELPLADLGAVLDARGISGAPVVRDGALVGVIARRDLRRAARADRLHLPVSSHMSGRVVTTEPATPLEDALRAMTDADVGRLPVLRGGRVVGIITRFDVRRALYGELDPR